VDAIQLRWDSVPRQGYAVFSSPTPSNRSSHQVPRGPGANKRESPHEVSLPQAGLRQNANRGKRQKLNPNERMTDKKNRLISLYTGVKAVGGDKKLPLQWQAKTSFTDANNENLKYTKLFPYTTKGEDDARDWLNELRIKNHRAPMNVHLNGATLIKMYDCNAQAEQKVAGAAAATDDTAAHAAGPVPGEQQSPDNKDLM
jgi:hypothetical protein